VQEIHSQRHAYKMGVIGNCAYTAHIDTHTNVCWLCWPQFDSSFIFGSLLDDEKGGTFVVEPADGNFSSEQKYIENTNLLSTQFTFGDNSYRVIDFAPRFRQHERYYKPLMLVRKIERLSGSPLIRVRCEPVADYGSRKSFPSMGSNHIRFHQFDDELRLTTNVPLTFILQQKSFLLSEPLYLVLTYGTPLEENLEHTCEDFLNKTIHYWRQWVKSTYISNFYQENIIRSALALKLHQFEQTGAIIASSTTSLPEENDAGRNWDYRYCWLRDSYYTLSAFNHIGHFEELENFFHFIANVTVHHENQLQPLYSVVGNADLEEKILPLKGYLGNSPVRIGNAAYKQNQFDVFGQVLVALEPLYTDHRFIDRERSESIKIIRRLLQMIDKTMEEPDAGPWEYRKKNKQHAYTSLFRWAGCSAALKIFRHHHGDQQSIDYAERLIRRSSEMIELCYNPEKNAYAEAIGMNALDASTLQLITLGYLDPNSEKAKRHLCALEIELKTSEGLFYRYRHRDDISVPRTQFLICSFWYVEALTIMGRMDEAIALFEKLFSFTNHLGLLSEDVDVSTGSQWGNFPQTYSHVGQINAAYRIAKKIDRPNFF